MVGKALITVAALSAASYAQFAPNWRKEGEIFYDTQKFGPEIELVHLYYDQFPTGIAVSRSGRRFSNYPPGLDANNTNDGSNGKYTIAELLEGNREEPFPSAEMNNPPGGSINYTTFPPTGANYPDRIIGSQSIVIDSADRAWILDTGRALTPNGTLVTSTYGGPKLIGVDLTNNEVFQTILFPQTVAYPVTYLNDVRLDLRPEITESGKGVAYITDSSVEGRNGIIIADLGTGESWRHLDNNYAVRIQSQNVAYLWGVPLYIFQPGGLPHTFINFGADGIALSADSEKLYWKPVGGRYMYSIPTERLRDRSAASEVLAQAAINNVGESGITDGLETDTNGYIYHGNMEQNAIGFYNPENGTDTVWVRDPRINWADTFSTGEDGYLYFTNNQLVWGSGLYPGVDRRERPFSLWRVQLPNGGTKPISGTVGNDTASNGTSSGYQRRCRS